MTAHTASAQPVDRTLHEAPLPVGFDAAPAPVPDAERTPHQAFTVEAQHHEPAGAVPGAASVIDHAQRLSAAVPPAPPRLPSDEDGRPAILAAQLATVSRSADRLGRARAYAARLGAHAAQIRARLDAAAGDDTAGPFRGELIEVERQREQALAILAEVEAEHARHELDLRAMHGSDGEARAALAEVQANRDASRTALDAARNALSRAEAHARGVDGKLTAAKAAEARHDAEAADRMHVALRDGTEAPAATEPFKRTSGALEDDLRAARAAAVRLATEHEAKAAALAEAERLVQGAVDTVLMSGADTMAREVQCLEDRSRLLRARISAYAARTAGDYVAPPWSPPKNILHPGGWYVKEPGKPSTPPPPKKVARTPALSAVLPLRDEDASVVTEATAWVTYAAALASDPQAEPAFADAPAPVAPILSAMPTPAMLAPRAA